MPADGPAPDNWENDAIQFPRLLAEIVANVEIPPEDEAALCASMDLDPNDVARLFDRAVETWERIKDLTPHGPFPFVVWPSGPGFFVAGHPVGTDTVAVTFYWSTEKGRCYNDGLPAAYRAVDAYGPGTTDRKEALRCSLCAATDAAEGQPIVYLFDESTATTADE